MHSALPQKLARFHILQRGHLTVKEKLLCSLVCWQDYCEPWVCDPVAWFVKKSLLAISCLVLSETNCIIAIFKSLRLRMVILLSQRYYCSWLTLALCATLYVSRTAGKPRRIHRTITSSIPCTVYCSAIGKKHHQLFWYRFCSQNQLLHGVLTCNVLTTRWWYMFHGIVPRWPSRTASDWHDGNILCTSETHFVNSQHITATLKQIHTLAAPSRFEEWETNRLLRPT